jgi:hypothetical protein
MRHNTTNRSVTSPEPTPVEREERIAVQADMHGYLLEYRDSYHETRYLPRRQRVWDAIKEAWRLGGLHPFNLKIYNPFNLKHYRK